MSPIATFLEAQRKLKLVPGKTQRPLFEKGKEKFGGTARRADAPICHLVAVNDMNIYLVEC